MYIRVCVLFFQLSSVRAQVALWTSCISYVHTFAALLLLLYFYCSAFTALPLLLFLYCSTFDAPLCFPILMFHVFPTCWRLYVHACVRVLIRSHIMYLHLSAWGINEKRHHSVDIAAAHKLADEKLVICMGVRVHINVNTSINPPRKRVYFIFVIFSPIGLSKIKFMCVCVYILYVYHSQGTVSLG